eukprot:SAG11_NODE_346_length_10432_cov_4.883770_11_plen_150_part_00
MLSDTEDTKSDPPQVWMLTVVFFWMFFLCATQDIAVDGWAITMLQVSESPTGQPCFDPKIRTSYNPWGRGLDENLTFSVRIVRIWWNLVAAVGMQEKNKGYAATANTVGQTAGYFIAFTGFLALKANDFCTLAQVASLQPTRTEIGSRG